MKLRFSLALSLLLAVGILSAQNFTYPSINIDAVVFSGDLDIKKDDGTGSYSTPQWDSAGTRNPVAYVSGQSPIVSAAFTMDCLYAPDSVTVRAIGPDSVMYPAVKLPVIFKSGTLFNIYYPTSFCLTAFDSGVVDYFKPYTIQWEVSFDGGTSYREIGKTENTVYVVRDNPMAETTRFKLFHTVYDISCRNAVGMNTEKGIIDSVWTEFTDNIVLNHNGDSLHYYKPMSTGNTSLPLLMKYRNAQCYTFAQLWLACLKIQGIVRTNNYVYITPINNTVCSRTVNRFIVKNWTFDSATATAECSAFPYKNTYTSLLPSPYTKYTFLTEDVSDSIGIYGSCSLNPSSYFNNHQISYIDGVYYDACYGVTFNSTTEIPTKAFSGWGYRYSSGGVTHALFTNDMTQSSLRVVVSTF